MSNTQVNALYAIANTLEQESRCDEHGIESAAIREAAACLAESKARELILEDKLAKTRDFLDDLWSTQSYDALDLHALFKELDDLETSTNSRYSIHPDGDDYVLYYDRCDHRHGYALATISELAWNCDLRHLELLLNLGAVSYEKNPTGGHVAE